MSTVFCYVTGINMPRFSYPQFGRNDFRTVVLFEIDAITQGTAIFDFYFQESGLCRFKFDRVGECDSSRFRTIMLQGLFGYLSILLTVGRYFYGNSSGRSILMAGLNKEPKTTFLTSVGLSRWTMNSRSLPSTIAKLDHGV